MAIFNSYVKLPEGTQIPKNVCHVSKGFPHPALRSTGKFFSNGFDPKHLLAESSMSDEAETRVFSCLFLEVLVETK